MMKYSSLLIARLSSAFMCLMTTVSVAQNYAPPIEGASDEGKLALEGFEVPDGIKVELWAAEPDLANPVAFGIDEQGRIYVCETFRQKQGVEDNRSHMNWLERDLSLNSVEERLEMFKEFLGEDVKSYGLQHDRIRLLEDTDKDGRADKATVFADGFNDILDGTGAGVLAVDGDVYYTCIPKLWKLRDTDGDGVADEREALHHGYGIRVAFRGHDMHGLILGPDGRLYWSIGDRGYNVMTKEGTHLFRPDTGAVFRSELDGSNLEVFAYGLRNPQELAFDNYGNLFTGDNNSDSGDQARWVHVVEGGDTGWRMYYQYLQDRGPWNRERIWYPYQDDEETTAVQPAYTLPPISWLGNGPSGLVHYPGVGLDPKYQDHFFLADFRGGSANSGIWSFAVKPNGATYELVDQEWFLHAILATDVDFGYDGKMYVSDWVDGWNGPGKGRIYTFTDKEHQYPLSALHSDKIMKAGLGRVHRIELSSYLSHPDQRIRLRAQLELVKREQVQLLTQVANARTAVLPRIHAIWGLGQLVRQGSTEPINTLIALLKDQDTEVRTQAIRVLADNSVSQAFEQLVDRVNNGTPREQYLAAIGLGKIKNAAAVPALVKLLETNDNADPVIRHSAVMGLVGSTNVEGLHTYFQHESDAVRLGVVLTLRRLKSAELSEFLSDSNPQIVTEAARAIHDLPIAAALPALAAVPVSPQLPDALLRRVINANFRLGTPDNAERVAALAASADYDVTLRREAVEELLRWKEPPVLDRVLNKFRPLKSRSLDVARDAVNRHIAGILQLPKESQELAIRLAARYEVEAVANELVAAVAKTENAASLRAEALRALAAINHENITAILDEAIKDQDGQLRAVARELLAVKSPETAVPGLAQALKEGSRFERQSAVRVLDSLKTQAADQVLLSALDQYLKGELAPEIQLDVLNIANARESAEFQNKLAKIEESRDAANPLASYLECLEGGDLERGKEIFFGNAAASCRRCHKVNGEGSDVGPDLSGVSKENPRQYLLESIVHPNAKIAKGFETVVFALDSGKVVSGVIKAEDDNSYKLMKPMGEIITVLKEQIDDRAVGKSGMPDDLTKQLSKSEIRDLVEYLSTLKTPVKQAGHE